VNVNKYGASLSETKNAELPLTSGSASGDVEMAEEGGLPSVGKEKTDYRGKPDRYTGKHREANHPFDRKSGTGKGKEVNNGHGKGNWGDIRDEIEGQL